MMNSKKRVFIYTLAIIAASNLMGCGGGGSGGPTTTPQVANKCANGQADYPTCTVPASLQSAAPATYAVGSPQSDVLIALNQLRTSMGLGPLNQNVLIDKAAANHKNYLNLSWISGEDAHNCWRQLNIDPPCQLKFDPGLGVAF
jgi:hypothetical protein